MAATPTNRAGNMTPAARLAQPDAPTRRALAESPSTPAARLAQLATDGNLHVRLAAARHPSLPRAVIDRLRRAGASGDLASASAPDPAMPASELAELAAQGEWARRLAAAHPNTPAPDLTRLAADPCHAIRLAVAINAKTPPAALEALLLDREQDVRAAAGRHPAAPAHIVALLGQAASDIGLGVATTYELDEQQLVQLAQRGPWGAHLAARHPATPPALLVQLSKHPQSKVRESLAENPAAPGDALAGLAAEATPATLALLAKHPNAPAGLLHELGGSEDFRIRIDVAGNPRTPGPTLARLAADGSHAVREATARNPAAPRDVIARLIAAGSSPNLMTYASPDPELEPGALDALAELGGWGRQLAARHPKTPEATLWRLANDANPLVREAVALRPAPPAGLGLLIRAGSAEDLQGFAKPQAALSFEEMDELMAGGRWGCRLAARHPSTPGEMLVRLAQHEDWSVRKAVARHASTPQAALIALIHDAQPDVRWSVVQRERLDPAVLDAASRDPIATIRLMAATHGDAPDEVVERLRLDLDEDVREAARARLGEPGRSAP